MYLLITISVLFSEKKITNAYVCLFSNNPTQSRLLTLIQSARFPTILKHPTSPPKTFHGTFPREKIVKTFPDRNREPTLKMLIPAFKRKRTVW